MFQIRELRLSAMIGYEKGNRQERRAATPLRSQLPWVIESPKSIIASRTFAAILSTAV